MYQRCLIVVLLVIFLVGCTAQIPEQTVQDPNVTPEGIRVTPDVVYGHKFGMALTFDMYQPENPNGAGVLYIASGGYYSGFANYYKHTPEGLSLLTQDDPEYMITDQGRNIEPFLGKGFTVFDVRHGSKPKFEMDEIVADLRRAVRFIRYHATDYGVNEERLGLWGVSSGGHLALLLGTTADIGNPEATDEFEKDPGRVAGVVVFSPANTNIKLIVDYLRKTDPERLKQATISKLEDNQLIEFSPTNFVSSDDPPTLIVHGDKDQTVPILLGGLMYQALQKAGIESKFVTIPGADHGFKDEDADHALAEAVSWFEKHLVEK